MHLRVLSSLELISASEIAFDLDSTPKRDIFFPYQPSETTVSQYSCDCNLIEFGLLLESSKNDHWGLTVRSPRPIYGQRIVDKSRKESIKTATG